MSTPVPPHSPPSLPASPLPKRTKVIAPSSLHANASVDEPSGGIATPTPPMALQPPAPITSSSSTPGVPPAAAGVETLQVQLLSDKARAPTRGSAFAAGYDLYSARDVVIAKRGRARVDTDIAVMVPVGTYGRVAPRSGLAAKHGIDTLAGVIDADYRGQVGVLLANLSDEDFEIKVGDRIAQLVVEKISMPDIMVVEKLDESVRGAGGFGSTGGFGAVAPTAATVNGV